MLMNLFIKFTWNTRNTILNNEERNLYIINYFTCYRIKQTNLFSTERPYATDVTVLLEMPVLVPNKSIASMLMN